MVKLSLSVQYASDADDEPPLRARVRALVRAAWRLSGEDGEITVRFVDAAESAKLNKQYRHKNKPTNVLSFCYQTSPIIGDIVICCAVVTEEATRYDISPVSRYAHLIVHGALHLLGYQHDTKQTAAKMELLESKILSRFKVNNPYFIST